MNIPIIQGYKKPVSVVGGGEIQLSYDRDSTQNQLLWFTARFNNIRIMTATHQVENISKQIRWGQNKAICLCATLYKGGGNNSVTYIIEFYEN